MKHQRIKFNDLYGFLKALIYCATCLSASLFAEDIEQREVEAAPESPLQAIHQTLSQHQSVKGNFTQSRQSPDFNAALLSSGRFIYLNEQGLYWEVSQPFFVANTFEEGAITQWESPGVPSDDQDSRNTSTMQHTGSIVISILQGKFASLEKHFTLQTQYSDSENWTLTLLPKVKLAKKSLKQITLEGGQQLEKIVIETPGNDLTVIDLMVEEKNIPLRAEHCLLFPHFNDDLCQS